jgi:hypothetical protein
MSAPSEARRSAAEQNVYPVGYAFRFLAIGQRPMTEFYVTLAIVLVLGAAVIFIISKTDQ